MKLLQCWDQVSQIVLWHFVVDFAQEFAYNCLQLFIVKTAYPFSAFFYLQDSDLHYRISGSTFILSNYLCKVCPKSIWPLGIKHTTQHNEYHKFYLISFKILLLQVHTLFPAPLPLLETPLELLWNAPELCHHFFRNVFTWLKLSSF